MSGASTPTHARERAKKRAKTSRGARVNARPGARGRQARSRPQNIALEGLRGPLAEPLTARVRSVHCAKSGFGIPILSRAFFHNQALKWFADHTGFVIPRSTNWAARARALVTHLDRSGVFGEDILLRNLFPWFVVHQLRARYSPADIPPRHASRPVSAFADLPPAQRVIALRHNAVQTELFARLTIEFGEGRVWTEYPTGTGGYADAIVRRPDGRCHLYEIKIASTAAEVVRQAMGQLLEYSFREGGLEPTKLFVVGEPVLDDVTRRFLGRLGADFNLDIAYLQVYPAKSYGLDYG